MPSFASLAVLTFASAAVAQQQIPLLDKIKGYFGQATASIASAVPSGTSIPNPIDAGTAAIASAKLHHITIDNWKSVLTPDASAAVAGPEEWIIYVDGGEKTCWGRCANATNAFNKATVLLAAAPNAPNLAAIDCEQEQILCNLWVISPPAIYHMLLPAPLADQSKPATTVRYKALNASSVTATELAAIHTNYEDIKPYEGFFHPFDGLGFKTGMAYPWAHLVYWVAKMPQWLPMIAISMFSRLFLGRRGQPNRAAPGAAGAGAPAAPQ